MKRSSRCGRGGVIEYLSTLATGWRDSMIKLGWCC
jgi:hypothetical protein